MIVTINNFSVMIYLISFGISIFFIWLAKFFEKKLRFLFLIIGILITCVLAGLRSSTVGTDINWYALPLYNNALRATDFSSFYNSTYFPPNQYLSYAKDIEIIYLLSVYACAKLNFGLNGLLFISQLLIEIPLIIALYINTNNKKNYFSILCALLFFYFISFNRSLNLMRQFIACSFFILSFTLLLRKKIVLCILLFVIAVLFHNSILFCLIIPILYLLFTNKFYMAFNHTLRCLLIVLFFAFLFILILFGSSIIASLLNTIGSQYASYITGDLHFSVNQIIIRLPLIIIFLISSRDIFEYSSKKYYFYLSILLLDLCVSQLSTIGNAYRISYYFLFFDVLFIESAFDALSGRKKIFVFMLLLVYCLVFWIFFIYNENSGETIPFNFYWEESIL